jgi:hypothetical protein
VSFQVIDLLRTVSRHNKTVAPLDNQTDSIPVLVKFMETLDDFQGSLESSGFPSPANVMFDARLLTCADFVSANCNPVFIAALRIILRSQSPPPMPEIQSVAPVSSVLQPPPSAKQQARKAAHLFGSIVIPLIKQANSSGVLIFFGFPFVLFFSCWS